MAKDKEFRKNRLALVVADQVGEKLGLLTYEAAARESGLSHETVRRYARDGILKRVYLGRTPLVFASSIRKWKRTRQ